MTQDYIQDITIASFIPGYRVKLLNIRLVNDDVHEERERFSVQLRNPVGVRLTDSTAVIWIKDDDGKISCSC